MDGGSLLAEPADSALAMSRPVSPAAVVAAGGEASASAELSANMQGLQHVKSQLHALLLKNFLLLRRRALSTLFYVCVPSLVVFGLYQLDNATAAITYDDGQTTPLLVRKCTQFDLLEQPSAESCTVATFAPNNPDTVAIMRGFSTANGLEYGTDVVPAATAHAIADEIAGSPGSIDAAVIFLEPTSWGVATADAAPSLAYELWVNGTSDVQQWAFGEDLHLYDIAAVQGHYAALQAAVDAAILGHVTGTPADIALNVGRFARLKDPDALETGGGIAIYGDLFVVLGCSLSAILVLQNIAGEKDAKLLAALRTVGLREWLHWLSWALAYLAPCCLSALMSTVLGNLLGLRLYTQASFFVHLITMLLFLQSFAALATFLGACLSRTRYVVLSSMLMLFLAVIVDLVLKTSAAAGFPYRYGSDSGTFSWLMLGIMPWFHFSRVYTAIATTAYQSDSSLPQFYSASDLSNATAFTETDSRNELEHLKEYETGTSLWAQFGLIFMYNLLAWYFGQVASSDEGSTQPAYFCLMPSYWGKKNEQALVLDADDSVGVEKSKSLLEQSVRCYKLSKAYNQEMALKEFTMEIGSSTCVALLGHNGAGKSTLIKTLTGLHPPTHGEAFIFGLDIREDVAQLQKIMGVCPQDDLLWLELTAREHLRMYAKFKGVAEDELDDHCSSILADVNLTADADNAVSSFSGGMKRRLSVGIASVATPRIMFLDEPSTGMDPLSKRRVWSMINRLKTDRVMLLTTHSMEEADALGDTVAIMDAGKLRAAGTSLFLKATFGKGHTVSLLSEPEDAPRVAEIVKSAMPSAEVMGSDAGNTSVSLPRAAMKGLPRLFGALMAEQGLVKEWGISNTTLEEVFLRLSSQHEINAQVEGAGDDIGRVMIVRRPKDGGADQDQVLCVIETSNPTGVVVVSPEDTHDTEMLVIPAPEEEEEPVAEEEMTSLIMPAGNRAGGGGPPTGAGAAPQVDPSMQLVEMVIPPGAAPGQELVVQVGGKEVTVQVPADAVAGQRITLSIPLPEQEQIGGIQAGNEELEPAGICEQCYAVVWKNVILALGCRKGPGCTGCCSFKCCELCCYIFLFAILAMIALITNFVSGEMDSLIPRPVSTYCANGALNVSWSVDDGWPASFPLDDGGGGYGRRQLDEHGGKGGGGGGSQFSSCDRSTVAAQMTQYSNSNPDNVWSPATQAHKYSGFGRSTMPHVNVWMDAVTSYGQDNFQGPDYYGTDSCAKDLADVSTQRSTPDIWYSDAVAAGSTRMADMTVKGFAPTGGGGLNSTYEYHGYTIGVTTAFRAIPAGEINTRVLAAQAQNHVHKVEMGGDSVCHNVYAESGRIFETAQAAATFAQDSFPAFAIEIDKSNIGKSLSFHYAVRLWPKQEVYPQAYKFVAQYGINGDALPDADGACCGNGPNVRQTGPLENPDLELQAVVNAVSNTIMRTKLSSATAELKVTVVPMPPFTFTNTALDSSGPSATWLVLYPLLTMLLMPSLSSMLSAEKEEGLFEMISAEGGRASSYLLGNYVFCFIYSVIFSGLFVAVIHFTGADQGDSAVQMPPGAVVALVFAWAVAQTGLVLFKGLVLFSQARHAAIFGLLSVLMSTVTALMFSAGNLNQPFPSVLWFFPPIAYARTVNMMLWYGYGGDFYYGIGMLFVDGLLYFGLAVVYTLTPGGFVSRFNQLCTKSGADVEMDDVVMTGGGRSKVFLGDDDVVAERERVCNDDPGAIAGAAIVIKKLIKNYKAVSNGRRVTKRAVNSLCLSINKGEIFGLLGPNGAGKTTTISMLTGLTPVSDGTATIEGFDIARQMGLVHKVIGVCPQFDKVWGDLTVRQHLVFYALLKGVPRSRTSVVARQLAEKVELSGDSFNKPASALSGGMKRRLSIAIALTGAPPCVFFDEPTTGLDPETRRHIWGIVKAQQASGRCIVITTHSMEEADALCNRIGIMAGGSLRCLGTQVHLKNKFGDGFKITINVDGIGRIPGIDDLMRSLSPDAKQVVCFGTQLTYTVPMADGDVAQVFNVMEQSKRSKGITEWGVTQASLEEVFVKVVTHWEDDVQAQTPPPELDGIGERSRMDSLYASVAAL